MSSNAPSAPYDDAGDESPPKSELPRGSYVGRYMILDRLGSGGMGIVYAAYDPKLDRRVALKALRGALGRDEKARSRL